MGMTDGHFKDLTSRLVPLEQTAHEIERGEHRFRDEQGDIWIMRSAPLRTTSPVVFDVRLEWYEP